MNIEDRIEDTQPALLFDRLQMRCEQLWPEKKSIGKCQENELKRERESCLYLCFGMVSMIRICK